MSDATVSSNGTMQFVTFGAGAMRLAVEILDVAEVIPYETATPLPEAPDFVAGVIRLRGRVIPLVHLAHRLCATAGEVAPSSKVVVVEMETGPVGFIVDRILPILRLEASEVKQVPPTVAGVPSRYLRGVVRDEGGLVLLLDLRKILTLAEQQTLPDAP